MLPAKVGPGHVSDAKKGSLPRAKLTCVPNHDHGEGWQDATNANTTLKKTSNKKT